MANEITEQIRAAVWNDPQPAMNATRYAGEWRRGGNGWKWNKGQARLTRTTSGNIYIHGNTGSGMAGTSTGVVDFLALEWNTDTAETVRRLCDLYRIELKLSPEQRDKYRRRKVAAAVAGVLVQSAQDPANQSAQGVQYLNGRGCDVRTGAFGLLTVQSIAEAKNAALRANLEGVTAETIGADFAALGLTDKMAETHPVVIPNATDGVVDGFLFRKVTQDGDAPKYLFSKGLERGAYCDRLTDGGRVVVVEGELDALRLRSLGAGDVVAIGGAKPGEKMLEILRRHHKTDVVYIPDVEVRDGKRKTELERRAVEGLRTMSDPDSGFSVAAVRVARLPVEVGDDPDNWKQDADSWGRTATPEDVRDLLNGARFWWLCELEQLQTETYEGARAGVLDVMQVTNRAREIYAGVSDPIQRGMFRRYVEREETRGFYGELGIDTHTLEQLDELNRNAAFRNDMKDGAARLAKAVESGDPDRMAAAVADLNETLSKGRGTRQEWETQLSQDWESVADMVANQPEPVRTKWALGRDTSDQYGSRWTKYGQVELWSDDITVFCAPTSHGKTMILFQTMLDLIRDDLNAGRRRRYLFVSREEQPRQLALRALNVWIDRRTLKNKSEYSEHADRRAALRCALKGVKPLGYTDTEFEALRGAVEAFRRDVFPRLAMVHTDGSAESITANIDHYKTQFERDGWELGAVFVDYFQLLNSDTPNRMRNYELKTICDALKQAAGRSGVPFVIAAQLNREALRDGVDGVTLANIGEGADIERIAHDVYMMWQTDKTRKDTYIETNKSGKDSYRGTAGARARRLFVKNQLGELTPRVGRIYIERLKAREGVTGLWALLPYDGESGQIDATDAPDTSTQGATDYTDGELDF